MYLKEVLLPERKKKRKSLKQQNTDIHVEYMLDRRIKQIKERILSAIAFFQK
jgi:hypothetical protein